MTLFILAASGWLLDMVVLSRLGPAGLFPSLFGLCYCLGFGLMALMVRSCPKSWSLKQVVLAVFLIGILGRIGFIGYPVGNDVYRYIWEGYIQNHGFNPYQFAPDDPALDGLVNGPMASIWPSINHKDFSAVYPPLTMLLFRLLAAISPTTMTFKMAMLAFDLSVLALLIAIAYWRDIPPVRLFWYAANPLVLVYVAGEGHVDIVQAAFLTGALLAIDRHKSGWGFLALGGAAVSKYIAGVVLPFALKRSKLKTCAASAALAGMVFIPFLNDLQAVFRSLFIFGSRMHYNDGLAEIVRWFFGSAALPMLIVIMLGLLIFIFLFEQDHLRSTYFALGVVLLCLPTLHPWYLLIIAPFMAIYPSRAWFYLMLASIIMLPVLAVEYKTGLFQEVRWLKLIEYVPFYGLLIYDALFRSAFRQQRFFCRPKTISVIIPALNEEERIDSAIHSVRSEPGVAEIFVVDGGSGDKTPELARLAGAKVIRGPRGRGRQVSAGIPLATGDVLLVLHADTKLLPGSTGRMLRAIARRPDSAGGAFGMAFEGHGSGLSMVAWLNNVRARWLGISFGDQAQFFRRAALEEMGGFPDMTLMEDVELSLRLKNFGRPLYLPHGVRVCVRRWTRRGFMGNLRMVMNLFFRYLIERRLNGPDDIRTNYYRMYYGRS
jgi:rSAM/selenodomain-associated transferase 2